jgi:hypothetical protein
LWWDFLASSGFASESPKGPGSRAAGVAMAFKLIESAQTRASGVRPGMGRGVDREPQPPPPRARLPHLGGRLRLDPGQRPVWQPVVDPVVLSDPGPHCTGK